ncbi:hypothetical protein B0H13DRAFT_2009292 [Mycena leptocephala]|nr:hypothetical protein B0H13DRAFT_2009292 [Mycena leptocephala]
MWKILHQCSETLQHFDFEGQAPTNDLGPLIPPITLPALRHLRIGYIDDLSILAACIYAPNLDIFELHDVLFCPVILPHTENTPITPCNLQLIVRVLAPSCARLRQLSFVGVVGCPRDAVDAFFSSLSELSVLVLAMCHPNISNALFQPEARYRVPKPIFPKLAHLNISLSRPTDLARFLLRHKTVSVPSLRRVDISVGQFSEAYGRPGTRSILAAVLEMNTREGMAVCLTQDPRIYVISQVAGGI